MMQKHILLLLFLLFYSSAYAQKLQTGLTLQAGLGEIVAYPKPIDQLLGVDLTYKMSAGIGYRFRLQPVKSRFFYDLGLAFAGKFGKSIDYYDPQGMGGMIGSSANQGYFSASIEAVANYPLYKGLSVGAGVEPTYYLFNMQTIDIPLVAKLSYDWKIIGISVSYKYGLLKPINQSSAKGRFTNEWQAAIFIPF